LSQRKVGTAEFATAIIERMGELPQKLKVTKFEIGKRPAPLSTPPKAAQAVRKELVGVDIFLDYPLPPQTPGVAVAERIAKQLSDLIKPDFTLDMISNRGVKVWPGGYPETFCVDHWRCRLLASRGAQSPTNQKTIANLLGRIADTGLESIKTENLYNFDGSAGYSLGQGQ
jgi:isocitrate dehydrogenase